MENRWTKEQQQVIDLRDCNLLVSAAAGSGKTAVLVERIISRIMEKEKPVDIDRLLVVTFTNAAAAEMRERIRQALEEKLEQYPEDIHLQRQVTLIHHAQITTIHSFCLEVIRNHFHTIALDPGFRIGDEGELKLLRHDVMERLLEEAYGEKNPTFLRFSEAFAPGRSDQELEQVILQLYDFSMGYPDPGRWRQQCGAAYLPENLEDFYSAGWMDILMEKLRLQIQDLKEQIQTALDLTREPDGPYMYGEALEGDMEKLTLLERSQSYGEYAGILGAGLSFGALSRKKDLSVSQQKKDLVREIRDQVKKTLKKLQEDYFFASPEEMREDMAKNREMVQVLLKLTDRFQTAYEQQKAEKNVVDFNDLEHFALRILVREEEGTWIPTPVAEEYGDYFEEIMIDEYQDSNLVQEILLTSVSKKTRGGHNVFMVGDVKQSIYRFRLARPELFMEKYRNFRIDEGPDRRIDLHKNFRSRSQVLEGVNLIFRQIMTGTVGGVEYDEEASLYAGARFEAGSREEFLEPELLLVEPEEKEPGDFEDMEESSVGEKPEEEQERDLRRLEALAAGSRILEIAGKEPVWDKEQKKYRPARYGDIVILLRTVSGWADTFAQVLGGMGIPAYTGGGSGYFSALEIKTVLAYLQVLDNPRQDIPLASVLRSPIGKLEDEELARLRMGSPGTDFYTCCTEFLKRMETEEQQNAEAEKKKRAGQTCGEEAWNQARNREIYRKLRRFWDMTRQLRRMVPDTPMHLLLWRILEETGYGDYAAAMPGGAQRRANLDMLVEKAVAYEATSYRGLFNFIRYIENLQKYEIDYGEASFGGETEDTVRIMSIHKSKGLEFPVVLVCGMGKSFNQQDSRSRLVLHPTLGIGCDYVDLDKRIKLPLLMKKVIGRQLQEENLGEELRVLYVAMTRAKEKLILMGGVKKLPDKMKKWCREGKRREEKLSYSCIISAGSYLDWVMPALLRHSSGEGLLRHYELPRPVETVLYRAQGGYKICAAPRTAGKKEEEKRRREVLVRRRELEKLDQGPVCDQETEEMLGQSFRQQYPYAKNQAIPGKMTVSELKKMERTEEIPDSVPLYQEPVVVPLLPRFKKPEEEQGGAARGTVYHRFLENLDFTGSFDTKFTESQLETMVKCGKILKNEAEWISRKKVRMFLASDVALRMRSAARAGRLRREQPFVLGVSADCIRTEWDSGEEVLIQGIIDAYFEEEDGIVLIDYKTDFIPEGGEAILVKRYGRQLDYYQMALERLTGKKVKEKLIYSFCLNQTIAVER